MATLALKYRPRILADLVGQEASVKALNNTLLRAKASGNLQNQAFLFAGVRGTGKTSTARILARALNCAEGPTPAPCGTCAACKASQQPDCNLDIVEIDAASRASVEDARVLREQVHTLPAFCRYRVYIIDEVHMLSRQAFDALLKILEEPPSHAVFVLATTELQVVPDTIKSRVQIFPFRLIPVGLIETRLKDVCASEGVQAESDSLRLLAEAGQGSMRDALTTLDRVISAGDGSVTEDLVREQLGIVSAVRVKDMLGAVLAGDAVAVLGHCDALLSLGTDWSNFWKELMLAFRSHLEGIARAGAEPHELLRLARTLNMLLQRERDLKDSSLPHVVAELALLAAAQMPQLLPLDEILKAVTTQPHTARTTFHEAQAHSRPSVPRLSSEMQPPLQQRPGQAVASSPAAVLPKSRPTASLPAAGPSVNADEIIKQEPHLRQLLEDVSGAVVEIRNS
jgi:DNA polymerase-3 subunit gamma/tau